jgi:hypothetical protein
MMPLLYGDTVIIVHRAVTGVDARGNDVLTETQETVTGCAVYMGRGTEQVGGTEMIADDVTVNFPDGVSITALDAMIIDGDKFEIQSSPNQWQSPFTGIKSYVEVQGRHVTGASV